MKFFHLSDLHIGKQLHHYNLREDQEHILAEVLSYAASIHPDAIVIAGDIYDKSVPSGEAVSLFDEFLTALAKIEPAIPVLIISGNHDSAQRLDYASRLLGSHQIYIAGQTPEEEADGLKKITLTDAFGEVDFWLLPFLKPGYVRKIFGGEVPESYTAAVQGILEREKIDFSRRNILVSHQFYTGKGESPVTCDSEVLSVGGIDNVDISAVQEFDYVALGHLHGAQRVGQEKIRYCGTLLKYSVSEANQKKTLHVVELKEKGSEPEIQKLPLHPLRDVRKLRGTLEEILEAEDGTGSEDYVSVTLTDEVDPYKPKEQLERKFHHILEVRMDNERTRQKLEFSEEQIRIGTPFETFCDFYKEMQGQEMSEQEQKILREILSEMKGEDV